MAIVSSFVPRGMLEFSPRFNNKGYHPPAVKKPDDCVNCHYCEIICPEFAIFSVEAQQASEGDTTLMANGPRKAFPCRTGDRGEGRSKMKPAVLTGEHYMTGDVACAEGALAAGCLFFGGYPITPATEIAEHMAARLPGSGRHLYPDGG